MKTLADLKAQLQAEEMRLQEVKRGQIVMLDLPTVSGSVQNGLRPCVIISNNKANKFSPNVIAVPLTSRNKKDMPTHYALQPSKVNGLKVTSTILAEQILTVSKNAIKRIIGVVEDQHIDNINKIIKESISLF
jgi:mRNA interferase MazF